MYVKGQRGFIMRPWLKMEILLSSFRSQTRFARACGKSDDWLSKIIVGRKDPAKKERELIASNLKVDDKERLFLKIED